MTLLIVTAVVGWVLFLFTLVLYLIGNRLNAKELNSVEVYNLALLLSNELREVNRSAVDDAIHEGRSKGLEPRELIYGLMKGVTINAKRYFNAKNENLDTLALVLDYVNKVT
jgi:hypothetical protein